MWNEHKSTYAAGRSNQYNIEIRVKFIQLKLSNLYDLTLWKQIMYQNQFTWFYTEGVITVTSTPCSLQRENVECMILHALPSISTEAFRHFRHANFPMMKRPEVDEPFTLSLNDQFAEALSDELGLSRAVRY